MSVLPVYSPEIPFLGKIPNGLSPALLVKMKAKITEQNGIFAIDFVKKPDLEFGRQDILFHISIRLNQKCMVRNSYQNGSWQKEERGGGFPITYNELFEIAILAENECFKIAVNDNFVVKFEHRLPFHLAQYMIVNGNVKIEHILMGKGYFEGDLLVEIF